MKLRNLMALCAASVLCLGLSIGCEREPASTESKKPTSLSKVEYGYGWMDAKSEWVLKVVEGPYWIYYTDRSDGVREYRVYIRGNLQLYPVSKNAAPPDALKHITPQ